MQKWEYLKAKKVGVKVLALNNVEQKYDGELPMLLNRLGEEGWELVAVTDDNSFYFKRPKP